MPSTYYENHFKELERIRDEYTRSGQDHLLFRAKCIDSLLLQEKVKDE